MNISKVLPRLFPGPSAISIYFFMILNGIVSPSCIVAVSGGTDAANAEGLKTYCFFYAEIIFFFRMKTKQETFSFWIESDSSYPFIDNL